MNRIGMQAAPGEFLLKRQAALATQPDVEDQAAGPVVLRKSEELLRRREGLDAQADRNQQLVRGKPHRFVIVDDTDNRRFAFASRRSRMQLGSHFGSS
jgi:hypothetical protein